VCGDWKLKAKTSAQALTIFFVVMLAQNQDWEHLIFKSEKCKASE